MANRGALEAMLSVTGQQEFAATMEKMMGSVKALGVETDAVSKQMALAGARMDTAFGAGRVTALRGVNTELGVMKGHLSQIVSMLGGKGLLTAFGLFEGVKNAAKVQTNAMQWVTEAGVPQSQVAGLQRLAGQQAGLGLSQIDAGQIIRMGESAYSGRATTAQLQGLLTTSAQISAISGGQISGVNAASPLIALLQSQPSLRNNPQIAAALINATVGAGNMTTAQLVAALGNGSAAALQGAGIPMSGIAGSLAYFADVQGGGSAGSALLNLITPSLKMIHPTKAGQTELDSLGLGNLGVTLEGPNGFNKAIERLHDATNKMFPGDSPAAKQARAAAISTVYGGSRGSKSILEIMGDYDTWLAKTDQTAFLSDPARYSSAANLAMLNPAQKAQVVKAGFSNAVTDIGAAVLPALTAALPTLGTIVHELAGPAKEGLSLMSKAFGVLANPIVLRVIEGLAVLKIAGAGMSMVGALQGRVLTSGSMGSIVSGSSFNPMAGYRAGLNRTMGAGLSGTVVRDMSAEAGAGASEMDRMTGSATRLRAALVGNGIGMAGGIALGAGLGYASTSSGGSLLTGGLTGALSGALFGMSAGPWGAAAGAVAGAAGAIIGHFHSMGAAAAANAQQVQDSITQIVSSGTSVAGVVSGDVSGNMDLQLGLNKLGITSGQVTAGAGNPAQLAAWRKASYSLQGNQGTQVRNLLDTLIGLPGAKRVSNQALGKTNTAFTAPSDKAILTWAEVHGEVSNLNAYGRIITPDTDSLTSKIRGDYAASHGMFYSSKTGFAPSGSTTVNVFPSEKMDEKALAKLVVDEMKKAGARQ